jgi:predicted ester cyclase
LATPEQNKEIVYLFNKGFIEQGNEEVFNNTIADNFINQSAPPGVPRGPEGVLYFFNQFLKPAFPDLAVEIYDLVAADDKVVTRKAFHATHKGTFMGIEASQKKVVMDVIDIVRLRDGKIVEHWNVLDVHSVLMQIQA